MSAQFFTNCNSEQSLLKRFKDSLENAKNFDILVAYFRTSGFEKLADKFAEIEKIRILIGINADAKTHQANQMVIKQSQFENYQPSSEPQFDNFENSSKNLSQSKIKEIFANNLIAEIEQEKQELTVKNSIDKFIHFLKSGKIELRAIKEGNIHAKLYIIHNNNQLAKSLKGSVITGSSNFSHSGLIAQGEFNVELRNDADYQFANEQFEKLWQEAVLLDENYLEAVKKTWLEAICPYHLYIKILYQYFIDQLIDENDQEDYQKISKNFAQLQYQIDAVRSAKTILNRYNGVFLSDVVGLGKTYMAAMLLKKIDGKKLIICPPTLKDYWEDVMDEFEVDYEKVESLGKIAEIIKDNKSNKYDVVVIDEAHRFRNENNERYSNLKTICQNKKVILLSATPFNNKIGDFENLITLFQSKNNSDFKTLNGGNLEAFFQNLKKPLNKLKKNSKEYELALKQANKEIRQKLLRYLMVRRTRGEIIEHYGQDLIAKNLVFPQLETPQKIIYQFNQATEANFIKSLEIIKSLKYSRYAPVTYLKNLENAFLKQQNINLQGFMKTLLIKRLESSFEAFKKTTQRFIKSYQKTIKEYENGVVHISKSNISLDIEDLGEDEIEKLINQGQRRRSQDFNENFIKDLKSDLKKLEEIAQIWQNYNQKNDPKLQQFLTELNNNDILKNQKIIIFTESSETAEYLYQSLNIENNFANQVFKYTSNNFSYKNQALSDKKEANRIINQNFDPNYQNQKNDVKILIATEILSEGVNLHRASIIINYDLPWNPTKMMQRAGRINRLGSKHSKIYIFNCFPTSHSEKEINLEKNILNKLQAFHEALGEDSKYLSELEEVSAKGLFEKLTTNVQDFEPETESDLKYLKIIKEIVKNQPELIEKIKKLPKQASGCKDWHQTAKNFNQNSQNIENFSKNFNQESFNLANSSKNSHQNNFLITFYQQGNFQRFIQSNQQETKELDFIEAIKFFECENTDENHKARAVPEHYFSLIGKNQNFIETQKENIEQPEFTKINKSKNYQKIKDTINFAWESLKETENGTKSPDYQYLKTIKSQLNDLLTSKISKKINDQFKNIKLNDTKIILAILKNYFKPQDFLPSKSNLAKQNQLNLKTEIILSQYFLNN